MTMEKQGVPADVPERKTKCAHGKCGNCRLKPEPGDDDLNRLAEKHAEHTVGGDVREDAGK